MATSPSAASAASACSAPTVAAILGLPAESLPAAPPAPPVAGPRVPIPRNGVDYRGKVVLAPMVRSGELPSRLLALKYGADLVWGPETIDRALIGTTRRVNPLTKTIDWTRMPSSALKVENPIHPDRRESVIYRLDPAREHKKLIFQLGTASPVLAVQAARLVAADVAGIDVNAGCPKPFSTSGGMGAALLQTPDTLCAILEALVKEIAAEFEIGISVKIRLLETPERTEALVRRLVRTGITALTVHCRTTPMRPRERAIREQLRMIGGLCREAGVACVMNGDVENRDQAMELIREYGVDGAMIATAAETNSSVFRAEKDGGKAPWRTLVEQYIRFACEVENRWGNTKYLLGQMIPGRDPVYAKMNKCRSYGELVAALEMENLRVLAAAVDERLELPPGLTKAQKRAKGRDGRTEAQKDGKREHNEEDAVQNGGQVKRVKLPEQQTVDMPLQIPAEVAVPQDAQPVV